MPTTETALKLPTPGTYDLDPAHTEVGFVSRHLFGTKVRGRFSDFSGTIQIAEPVEQSTVTAEVQAKSIDTGQDMRDDHLRSNDFLAMDEHPTLTLVSTGLRRVSDREWQLDTDLTIRGVTKPVTFDVEYFGAGEGLAGAEVFGLSAAAEIDRRDFGVSFNRALDAGGVVVANKVRIEIELEASLRS